MTLDKLKHWSVQPWKTFVTGTTLLWSMGRKVKKWDCGLVLVCRFPYDSSSGARRLFKVCNLQLRSITIIHYDVQLPINHLYVKYKICFHVLKLQICGCVQWLTVYVQFALHQSQTVLSGRSTIMWNACRDLNFFSHHFCYETHLVTFIRKLESMMMTVKQRIYAIRVSQFRVHKVGNIAN